MTDEKVNPVAIAEPKAPAKKKAKAKKPVVKAPVMPTEATETGAIKAPGSTQITLDNKRSETRYEVWMGVTEECPFWTVHAGGRDFPRFIERLVRDENKKVTGRDKLSGKVVTLSPEDITFISESVGKKVLRKAGNKPMILNITDPRYSVSNLDRPLGEFVYMQIIGGKNLPHNWRESAPEPMV
tara:strand:+ start:673 stop:1224 length:552 start_codon:yes stop_codon:yes gene_type:complete